MHLFNLIQHDSGLNNRRGDFFSWHHERGKQKELTNGWQIKPTLFIEITPTSAQ